MGSTPMVDAVRGITLCMAILCTIVCCLRLYMRWFVVKSFNVDDYLVIVALILVNGFSALAYTISYYGLGDHQADVIARGDLVTWLKIYYAALCSYLVVAAAVKLSLTTFIMRIFPQRYVQRTGYAIIVFIVAFTVSGELILAFQCKPVRAFWDKTIITAQCFSNDTLFAITMYQGVLMFVCDIVIIVLPMPAIWRLQMALKKRLLVLFLFSFGVIACIAALVRFSTLVYTKDTTDMTYSAAMSLIWMEIEFNFGLLAGSLGSLRKLFKIKSIFSSGQRYGSSRRYELDDIRGAGSGSAPTHYLSKDNRRAWKKGGGILKSYEVTSTVDRDPLYDEFEGRVGRRPDSQEHIMLENGNGMVYGQGDPIKVHIRAAGP